MHTRARGAISRSCRGTAARSTQSSHSSAAHAQYQPLEPFRLLLSASAGLATVYGAAAHAVVGWCQPSAQLPRAEASVHESACASTIPSAVSSEVHRTRGSGTRHRVDLLGCMVMLTGHAANQALHSLGHLGARAMYPRAPTALHGAKVRTLYQYHDQLA